MNIFGNGQITQYFHPSRIYKITLLAPIFASMTHIHESNQNGMEAMQSCHSIRSVLPSFRNPGNEIKSSRNSPRERQDSKPYGNSRSASRPTEVCPISSSYYKQLTSRTLSSNIDSPVSSSPLSSTTSFRDVTLTLKVVLIGDSQVGKSNLVLRFTNNTFHAHSEQTVGTYSFSLIR